MTAAQDRAGELARRPRRARRLRRERPGGPVRRRHELRREGGADAQGRAGRVPPRREVRRRPLLRPVDQAPAHRARVRGLARLHPALAPRAPELPLRRARGAHHALRPARADARSKASIPARAGRDLLPYLPESGEVVNRARRTGRSSRRRRARGRRRCIRSSTATRRSSGSGKRSPGSAGSTPTTRPRPGRSASSELKSNAARLTERRFDAIRLHGPGTDLTIGLLPSSAWEAGDFDDGRRRAPLPEHPDRGALHDAGPGARRRPRVARRCRSSSSGPIIEGIRVEFEGGRAVKVDADKGADALRAVVAKDEGAARLGELALVDGEGRIGPLQTRLPGHAHRRERRLPHRARAGLRVAGRGRGGAGARQPAAACTSTS